MMSHSKAMSYGPQIITASPLVSGEVGFVYASAINVIRGSAPYTIAVVSGSLPAGLGLVGNVITGTPTTPVAASFSLQATDSKGAKSSAVAFGLTVVAAITITTTSLPNATQGIAYSTTLASSGGVTPTTWAMVAGSLDPGLSLNPNTGTISGTPTTPATYTPTFQVTDALGYEAQKQLSLVVATGYIAPSITTTSIPQGYVGVAYSFTLQGQNGTLPYAWTVSAGALPAGLSLAPSTGVISGTPTGAGTSSFTIQLEDAASTKVTQPFTLTIASTASTTFKFNPGRYFGSIEDEQTETFTLWQGDVGTWLSQPAGFIGMSLTTDWGDLEDFTQTTNLNNPANSSVQYPGLLTMQQCFYYEMAAAKAASVSSAHFIWLINFRRTSTYTDSGNTAITTYAWGSNTGVRSVPFWICNCTGLSGTATPGTLTVPDYYGASTTSLYSGAVAPIFSGSPYYGFAFGNWNYSNGFDLLVPKFWEPPVNQAQIQALQAAAMWVFQAGSAWSSSTAYTVGTPVTYNGGNWLCVVANTNSAPSGTNSNWMVNTWAGTTLDTNPNVEAWGTNDEYSDVFLGGSGYNIPGSAYQNPPYNAGNASIAPTAANAFAGMKQLFTSWQATTPHTMTANNLSYGFLGSTSDTDTTMPAQWNNYIAGTGLSAIRGQMLGCANWYATSWQTTGYTANQYQQGHLGISPAVNGTGNFPTPTYPSLVGVSPVLVQHQPEDYWQNMVSGVSPSTTGPAAVVTALAAVSTKVLATHEIWSPQTSYNNSFNNIYKSTIQPTLAGIALASTAIPTSLVGSTTLNVLTGPIAAVQGFPLVLALQVAGGVAPYSWALQSQTGGNSATVSNSGLLTIGSPVATGSITVVVTDTNSATSGSVTIAINVQAQSGSLAITSPSTLPKATPGEAYFYELSASGGKWPYSWYVGPAYSSTAAGYTGASGTVWLIQAAADAGYLQAAITGSGTDSVPVTVVDAAGSVASTTITIPINSTLTMSGVAKNKSEGLFPSGFVGCNYGGGGFAPAAVGAGGTAPLSYSLVSGGPPGLVLRADGTWKQAPTTAGTYSSIVIQVTDSSTPTPQTAQFTYSMTILPAQTVPIPAWNAALAKPVFFTKSGQFYDPGGVPFRPRGLNRNHYDNGGDAAAFVASRASAVRYVLYYGQTDATQASDFNTQHLANDQYGIVARFATTTGTLTSGSSSFAVLGNCVYQWVTNASSWLPLQGLCGFNPANEWGPSGSIQWLYGYLPTTSAISAMTTTQMTLSTVSSTHPLANNYTLGYVYVQSAGGVTNQLCPITAIGGVSGAWTVAGTFPSGYTSGGSAVCGVVGMMRAAGYNGPLHIDAGGSGQDLSAFVNYGAQLVAADPLENIVLGYHLYGDSTNIACPVTSVTTGSTTAVHYSGPAWMSAGYSNNPFYTFEYNGNFQGKAVVFGAGGVTGLNSSVGNLSSQAGTQPSWSANLGVSSSGTYTSGGYILDSYHYMLTISTLASLQSQGVCCMIEEFGPALPPLAQGIGSNTLVTSGQVIRTAEANGLGWLAWAMDDGASGPAINNGYTACLYVGVYTGQPSQLSYSGLDVILNPDYGVTAASTMASYNV